MKYIFFTLNNFAYDGGSTIRMYGILNSLADKGHDVWLMSNAKSSSNLFNRSIKHIYIGELVSHRQKRNIQFASAILPTFMANYLFINLIKKIEKILAENRLLNCTLISFEYLDNTMAYLLKEAHVIQEYYNDLHGIAPLEFLSKMKFERNISIKLYYLFKYFTSELLDRKVFYGGRGFIFASKAMREYYCAKYNWLSSREFFILPYVLYNAKAMTGSKKNNVDIENLIQFKNAGKTIIAFAGSFKKLGGVPDLVKDFIELKRTHDDLMLMLLGDGETLDECKQLVTKSGVSASVLFLGRIPYELLQSYYYYADIVVCPDKKNNYSELIVHAKYYDALLSGKIVVVGNFASIIAINNNRKLSEIYSLASNYGLRKVLSSSIKNKSELLQDYHSNTEYVIKNFQYNNFISKGGLFNRSRG